MTSASAPAFTLPTMADVHAAAGSSGYAAVSTFSGAGGSTIGLKLAGFDVLAASEFIKAARDTYAANFPETPILDADIREISSRDVLDAIGGRRVDVFEGSPPCSAFSTAGSREAGWGVAKAYSDDAVQVADDLFFEWVRVASGLDARVLVAENVAGLARGTARGYLKLILAAIRDIGYRPAARIVNAAWLGVPQARERLIIVAVRDDLAAAGIEYVYPTPQTRQISLREAIDLPAVPQMRGSIIDPETGADISLHRYAVGREWHRTEPGRSSERYFQLVRSHPERPANTLTATAGVIGAASVAHPTEPRKFTVAEARTISGFPADFILTGNYSQRIERLGRAVPPPVYAAIGANLVDLLRAADTAGIRS